ncbi:MAG: rhodanese-like domain-containing protein [Muricomes sp.]
MKRRLLASLLCVAMAATLVVGCSNKTDSKDSAKSQNKSDVESVKDTDTKPKTDTESEVNVEAATAEQVQAYMNDSDDKTILVDARPQEAYSGWAVGGAANGGHLKNSVLFSARWLDCEYSEAAPREAYLERALKDQNITEDKDVIVYDYTGEQASNVAKYFQEQGIKNVSVFKANELIDAGTDLESYTNYDRFVPTEIVKSVSDVKTGKEKALSDEAKAVFGEDLSKVVLVDVGWGNAKQSSYFSAGHVPGAVHINTDSYERPRVYVPEKRSDYAKEWRLISLEEFRDSICTQYGITKDSTVILTGTSTAPQGRLGFMLRTLGVKVYVMSGSLTAWNYNGYELDTDASTLVVPESVSSFGSDTIANPDEILWMDDIKAILKGDVEGQVADNRGEDEWKGEYSGYSYHDLAGRIDGSIWCAQSTEKQGEFFANVDTTPRTQAETKAYLESSGLDVNKTMAFFCGDSWGAAKIAYWCQSVDLNNVKEWGNGWIPWSNEGNEFIDHNGNKVHYDKYQDAVLDKDGKVVSDGTNLLADAEKEE